MGRVMLPHGFSYIVSLAHSMCESVDGGHPKSEIQITVIFDLKLIHMTKKYNR